MTNTMGGMATSGVATNTGLMPPPDPLPLDFRGFSDKSLAQLYWLLSKMPRTFIAHDMLRKELRPAPSAIWRGEKLSVVADRVNHAAHRFGYGDLIRVLNTKEAQEFRRTVEGTRFLDALRAYRQSRR